MKSKMIAALILTIGITGCASNDKKTRAPSDGRAVTSLLPGGALLIGFDTNYDYQIDREEYLNGRSKTFENADLNSNGVINLSEFRYWQPKAMGSQTALPNLVYFDRNFDDRITLNEFNAGLDKLFDGADSNSDSRVSYQELVEIVAAPEARRGKGAGGKGAGGQKRQGKGQGRGQRNGF